MSVIIAGAIVMFLLRYAARLLNGGERHSPRGIYVFAVGGALLVGLGAKSSGGFSGTTGLIVREEPNRVVLQWSGPVQEPMHERFVEAFARFEDDPRQLVIALDSPGGSVEHGHQVIKEIRKISRQRAVDTLVESGKMCASMCVPIYLVGAERHAHAAANFMFHEASLRLNADVDPDVQRQLNAPGVRKAVIDHVTNELFDDDMGPRSVDARWLRDMRSKIKGRDVWLTGQQLMDQGSGVVDTLLAVKPK